MPAATSHALYSLDAACLATSQPSTSRPPLRSLQSDAKSTLHSTANGTATFTTLLTTADDNAAPCFDYIHVRALSEKGDEVAVPRVLATPSGYQIAVTLWPSSSNNTNWRLSARLVWHAFDREGWRSLDAKTEDSGCFAPFDAPLVWQHNVSVLPHHSPLHGHIAVPPGECGRDDLPLIGLRARIHGQAGWPDYDNWPTPPGCLPIFADGKRLRDAITNKWVLFVGQSTLLEHFGHLLHSALQAWQKPGGRLLPYHSQWKASVRWSTEPLFSAEAVSCYRDNMRSRDYDYNPLENGRLLPPHTRLSMIYDGTWYACGTGGGIPSAFFNGDHNNLTTRARWLRTLLSGGNSTPWEHRRGCTLYDGKPFLWPLAPSSERCDHLYYKHDPKDRIYRDHLVIDPKLIQTGATRGWPHGPDVVILAAGPHDFQTGPSYLKKRIALDSWAEHLTHLWELVEEAISSHGKRPHLIWMSMGAVYTKDRDVAALLNRSFCPSTSAYAHPLPVTHYMNQIAIELALKHGASILDQAVIRELEPHAGDGMHCLSGDVCNGVLNELVRLLELGAG